LISRRSIQALIVMAISACVLSGCFDGGGGYNYGYPGYPVNGYAPYAWSNSGYHPDFDYHHPYEEHHNVGHPETFYHEVPPRPAPMSHAEAGGHAGGGGHPVGHAGGHH
jgi:hypothetical protein